MSTRGLGAWSSDLDVASFAACRMAGFRPVGLVMGVTVNRIGYRGWGDCGVYQPYGYPARYRRRTGVAGTAGQRWNGYPALVAALYDARRTAVERLLGECEAVGGDGVVGARLVITPVPGVEHAFEFRLRGTAIRSLGEAHTQRPFVTHVDAADLAKLLDAGWVPTGLVFGVAVGVRHDDWATRRRRRSWSNGELEGYTELMHETRAQVRRDLAVRVAAKGGTAVVVEPMQVRVWEQECRNMDGVADHCAEATLVGTAVAPWRSRSVRDQDPTLALRLDELHGAVVGRRLSDDEEEFA